MAGSTYTGTKGFVGSGAVFSIGGITGNAGDVTFNPVGEIQTYKADGLKRGTVKVTTLASLGIERKLDTTVDYGNISLTVNYIGNDVGQTACVSACAAGGSYDFKIQFPVDKNSGQTTTGDLVTFSAIVTEAGGFDFETDKQVTSTITLAIDGAWLVTAGN